jgi:hypothetical protein
LLRCACLENIMFNTQTDLQRGYTI